MTEFIVTVEGCIDAEFIIKAEDEDDAREQAELLFVEHVTFDDDIREQVEDFCVGQVEATEVESDEEE